MFVPKNSRTSCRKTQHILAITHKTTMFLFSINFFLSSKMFRFAFAHIAVGIKLKQICYFYKICNELTIIKNKINIASDVVILTDHVGHVRQMCRYANIIHPDTNFKKIITKFYTSRYGKKENMKFAIANMHKWYLTSLTYDVILYMDIDVVFSPKMNLRVFENRVEWFVKSRYIISSTSDHESPINAGIIIFKPNATIFRKGMNLLKTNKFTKEYGFNNSFRPHELFKNRFTNTRMMKKNTWNFFHGDSDQGLFTLMYLNNNNYCHTGKKIRFHHYWSLFKPHNCRNFTNKIHVAENDLFCMNAIDIFQTSGSEKNCRHINQFIL